MHIRNSNRPSTLTILSILEMIDINSLETLRKIISEDNEHLKDLLAWF